MKKINTYIKIFILLFLAGLSRNIVAQVSTNQFKGVNWADPRDNFQTGVIYISGLSSTDTYSSASIVADRVVGQFVSKLGSNSVRLPINEATVSNYWNTYTGAIDMALTKGKVIICYWSQSSGADPVNITAFWAMWTKVVAKYGSNPNCYFEVFNEPSNYTKTELLNLYDTWLKNYPAVPQNHIVLDGTGLAMNVPDVGSDPRFINCLLAVHDYSFFASYTTEQEWRNHLKGFVGAYAHRTIMTEFGAPMKPGTKNGINYGVQDYNNPTGTYFVAYMRGMTSQLREWNMGSFYWPGLRDNDWYSLTTRTGSGANITLTLNNQSGLDRVHYAWGGTSVPQTPYNGTVSLIPGTIQLENYDVGGNSYAYNDITAGNTGGASFRTNEDVDIEMCTDAGGGYNIGFATAGEWLEYTVNVQKAASYDMSFRVACNGTGRTISVSMDGITLSNAGNIAITNTTAWQTWATVTIPNIPLKAGQQVMRVTVGATDYVNLNYVQFVEHVTACTPPSAPTVTSSLTYCQGATAPALTANGTALKWYTVATTGTGSSSAPMPSTTSVGTINHYVSQTVNGCESNRAAIAVTVNALPPVPTVMSSLTYCQGATTPALTANGSALKWYPAATTGTGSSSAPMPSTTSSGIQNQYVSQTVNGCESNRAHITVIVDAKPSTATVGANQSISSSSATLTANTPAIGIGTWTRISGTGTIADIHNPASGVSGLSPGSNSFRWTISNGSCPVSSNDLFIVVGNAPVTQVINGPDSTGFGTTVSFSVQAHAGSSYNWTVPTGATIASGQNTNSIQVVFGSTAVTGIITVAETNAYGSAASQKNVLSGSPPTVANIAGPAEVHEGATSYTYSVPSIPKTNYNWTVPQDAVIVSGQGSNTIIVLFPAGTNSGALGVTATNAFGSSVNSIPVTVSTITTNTSSMTKYTHVTVAPNPFVDETSIDFHYKKNAGSAMLKVVNMQGEIVYESAEFDINETFTIGKELKSGIYIVVVIYENQSYVRTVVKNQ